MSFVSLSFKKNFFISSNYKIYRIKIVGFPYFFNTCRVYILLLLFFFISLCRGLLIFFALNLLNRGFLLLPYKFIFLYFRCHSFFFSVVTNIIESKSIDKETTYIVSKLKLTVHLYPIWVALSSMGFKRSYWLPLCVPWIYLGVV